MRKNFSKKLKTVLLSVSVLGILFGTWQDVKAEEEITGYDTISCDTPSDEQVQQWIDDGTWETRKEFMESLNNSVAIMSKYTDMATAYDMENYSDSASNQGVILDTFLNAMPSMGNVTIPVFLVQFSDVKNEDAAVTPDSVKRTLFSEDENSDLFPVEGVTGYYNRSSYGQLNISGDVYDWLTLSNTREYYQNVENGRELVIQEIIDAYDSSVDFSRYDSNGDGFIDGMYILYAGDPEYYGDFYWAYKTYTAYDIVADGVNFNVYVWMPYNTDARTAIHETGHLMGGGDYYTTYLGVGYTNDFGELGGLGYFDMLDHNIGDMNIFTKMLYGWVEPVFVTSDTDIDLYSIADSRAKAVIVTNEKDNNIYSEYYILELFNNEQNNWDSALAENGAVRIYHVDAEIDETDGIGIFKYSNDATTSEFKLIRLMESDGKDDCAFGSIILPESYYYAGMSFGPNTAPSSEFYGGEYTGIQIDINNVSKDKANVSVRFVEDTKKPEYLENNDENVLGFIFKYGQLLTCFDSYIYEGSSFDGIKLYKKGSPEQTVDIEKSVLASRAPDKVYSEKAKKSRYNQVIINIKGDLEAGAEYILEYPEGAVRDAAGNVNNLIQLTYKSVPDANNVIEVTEYDSSSDEKQPSVSPTELPVDRFISKPRSVTAHNPGVQLCHSGMQMDSKIYKAVFVNKAYANAMIDMRKTTEPIGLIDNDGYPYVERVGSYTLAWGLSNIASVNKIENADGYIVVFFAMKHSLEKSGWGDSKQQSGYIFRLDENLNVLWGADVGNVNNWAENGVKSVESVDGMLYVKTNEGKLIVLKDMEGMLVKAERKFTVVNLNIIDDNMICNEDFTVGQLRQCFSGEIQDIKFYNSDFDIIEDGNAKIPEGLIKVTSGEYSWYYRVKAHEHVYGDWVIISEPTCNSWGQQVRTCMLCGEQESQNMEPIDVHNYSDWFDISSNTCISDGEEMRVCYDCGNSQVRIIPASGEHTAGDWIVDKEATVEVDGSRHKECKVCGYVMETEKIEKLSPEPDIKDDNGNSLGDNGWHPVNGESYWYENGERQGVKYDAAGNIDISYRGKEIYDPSSNAWYWLDSVQDGAVAKNKDVYQDSEAGEWGNRIGDDGKTYGKWVRYDADGHMVKGWQTAEAGTYYFDLVYGTMAKGNVTIDGRNYIFDQYTGILVSEVNDTDDNGISLDNDGWHPVNGESYWYENGERQGVKYNSDGSIDMSYRGKEIYDSSNNAWYWLDSVQDGAIAKNKDVYQDSEAGEWGNRIGDDGKTYGKWVRYDADGHMVKGWQTTEAGTYYFDPVYGTMAKGEAVIDGRNYYFDIYTGVLQ